MARHRADCFPRGGFSNSLKSVEKNWRGGVRHSELFAERQVKQDLVQKTFLALVCKSFFCRKGVAYIPRASEGLGRKEFSGGAPPLAPGGSLSTPVYLIWRRH